ncbi:MAG: hypothetical protein HKN13_01455 [Rhodothermales bacterium]|nr:hypothetical protein [Rhodothermales bacterium]
MQTPVYLLAAVLACSHVGCQHNPVDGDLDGFGADTSSSRPASVNGRWGGSIMVSDAEYTFTLVLRGNITGSGQWTVDGVEQAALSVGGAVEIGDRWSPTSMVLNMDTAESKEQFRFDAFVNDQMDLAVGNLDGWEMRSDTSYFRVQGFRLTKECDTPVCSPPS